jgi:hypothetical protein
MSERNNKDKDQSINAAIDKFLKAYNLDGRMQDFDIINGWEEMMGKAIALRTEKIYIRNRILHLKMNSSVMRDELLFGKQVIIDRVNQKAGKQYIVDVWFE